MPRTLNQFYANPAGQIGASLGRALFGDPAPIAAANSGIMDFSPATGAEH